MSRALLIFQDLTVNDRLVCPGFTHKGERKYLHKKNSAVHYLFGEQAREPSGSIIVILLGGVGLMEKDTLLL